MNLPEISLKNPYAILALALVVVALGSFAFWRVPTDLFPETVPPQVSVVTVKPGASALDVADKVTQLIEKELSSLSGLKRIVSTSRDEVSSINVEFLYSKPIGEAVTDVQNAVARIRGSLPSDIEEPRLYRITDSTRPLATLSLTPKPSSLKRLADIRLLAENDLKDRLLTIPGIGDVQVFGAHRPEVEVRVNRDALTAHGLTLREVIAALATQNVAAPGGTIYTNQGEYLIKIAGELTHLSAFENLPIRATSDGQLYLRNVATVRLGESDLRSMYHGNGEKAIALNILRPEQGHTVNAIQNLKAALPQIEKSYPDIDFAITDDQQPLIDLNVSGMRSSLWQAVILTVLVIFLFLANLRAAAVVSVTIPLSFLAALAVLWFSPYTLNMVTLSGLIIAVGMVVDASIVVLENIYRRHSETNFLDARQAAISGARQVAMPITAGMLTTVVVLIPVIFTQGYTGTIMKPLNIMIIATLVASLLISLTIIPILAAKLLGGAQRDRNVLERMAAPIEKGLDHLTSFYLKLVGKALRSRVLFLIAALIFLVFSLRVVKPLLGGEQMPPMDTGIAIVEFDTDSSMNPQGVEAVLSRVESMLKETQAVTTISSVVGSEAGAVSFGGGGATTQSAKLTVHLLPRTERSETIWDIESKWREALRTTAGVRTFRVSEYGATPVSTTKAPFNMVLSGPDPLVLDTLADEALQRLRSIPGLTDLRRSWYRDKAEQKVVVDPELAKLYGTSPAEVATVLRTAVQGNTATALRLDGYLDIPVRVRYRADQMADVAHLEEVYVPTRFGPVPLGNLAQLEKSSARPFITRENLRDTIDITGGNQTLTISQVTTLAKKGLANLPLPAGYNLEFAGTVRDMGETQGELGRALIIGLVLLFILLMAMFKSFAHPVTIMLSIPLAAAGAMWGLLLFDKPFCMPALMGIILLGGTIVNNAILMLDFIIEARKKGMSKDEAILQSVRLRLRPILMTAVSTIIGFSPLIFEMAVGLERMSPLGIAAASGLLIGTVVTLVAVPVIYSVQDSLAERLSWIFGSKKAATQVSVILLTITLAGTTAARANEPLPTPLPLGAAIQFALEHSPDLALSRAEVERQQGKTLTAGAAKGLHLDIAGSTSWSDNKHTMVSGVSPSSQAFDNWLYQGTLSARYLLTDFGKTEAELSSAILRHEAANDLGLRRRQEIIFEVSRQYLAILTLDDLLQATAASQKSLQSLAQATDNLVAQGRAARVDSLKIRVRLAEVESLLAKYEGNRRVARAALAALLGSDRQLPPLVYSEGPEAEKTEENSPLQVTNAAESDYRPDINARTAEAQAAQEEVKAAKRSYMPKVELWATTGLYGASTPEDTSSQRTDDRWDEDSTVGLRLSLPLLDGHLRQGQVIQAQAQARAAEAALRKQRLVAAYELEAAHAGVQSALAQETANRAAVEQAKEALRIEQLKYQTGKGGINDVLDTEAALLETEVLLRQARRSVEVARLSEVLALGR